MTNIPCFAIMYYRGITVPKFMDKIPKVNRQHREEARRMDRLKEFVLSGPVVMSQQDAREVLGVHNVTLEKDLQSPEFINWYRKIVQPIIDRKKQELVLAIRADLKNLNLKELRKL